MLSTCPALHHTSCSNLCCQIIFDVIATNVIVSIHHQHFPANLEGRNVNKGNRQLANKPTHHSWLFTAILFSIYVVKEHLNELGLSKVDIFMCHYLKTITIFMVLPSMDDLRYYELGGYPIYRSKTI